jgi:hypothetical protein
LHQIKYEGPCKKKHEGWVSHYCNTLRDEKYTFSLKKWASFKKSNLQVENIIQDISGKWIYLIEIMKLL